ncbi:hypothetical protein D9M72_512140 [compost metagenome]
MPMSRFAHTKMLDRIPATPEGSVARMNSQPAPARTMFAAGPAMATSTERPGVAVKPSNWVWPPQRLSTIFSVGQWKILAVRACASSWTSTERSRSRA